jgi:7-cyano-7-deazaguanine synthase
MLGASRHIVVPVDLRAFGGSALTDAIDVPKDRDESAMSAGIPITYVPARNTIFLSLALGWAEVLGARDLFIGVNAVDYSGYPDCRPEFVAAFERLANLATKAGVEGERWTVHAPLIQLTKAEIIRQGMALGVDYGRTHSCYDPDAAGRACGHCDSCQLRLKGFANAGLADPAPYQSR